LALVFYLLFYKVKNESFMFEVSKYKQCQGGAYMHQSDPELQKYCTSLPQDIINNINCPKNVVYTPESNASWDNPRCNSDGTPTSD